MKSHLYFATFSAVNVFVNYHCLVDAGQHRTTKYSNFEWCTLHDTIPSLFVRTGHMMHPSSRTDTIRHKLCPEHYWHSNKMLWSLSFWTTLNHTIRHRHCVNSLWKCRWILRQISRWAPLEIAWYPSCFHVIQFNIPSQLLANISYELVSVHLIFHYIP